jgi:hypothetical protein
MKLGISSEDLQNPILTKAFDFMKNMSSSSRGAHRRIQKLGVKLAWGQSDPVIGPSKALFKWVKLGASSWNWVSVQKICRILFWQRPLISWRIWASSSRGAHRRIHKLGVKLAWGQILGEKTSFVPFLFGVKRQLVCMQKMLTPLAPTSYIKYKGRQGIAVSALQTEGEAQGPGHKTLTALP